MSAVIEAPRSLVESVAAMRFPRRMNELLRSLLDRNNNGELSQGEHEALEALVELSESMSLVRAQALRLLGKSAT
jgi:hypothetical protein